MLLPRLGFRGTYNEPELSEPEEADAERHISEEGNEGVVEGVDEDQGSDDSDDNNVQLT